MPRTQGTTVAELDTAVVEETIVAVEDAPASAPPGIDLEALKAELRAELAAEFAATQPVKKNYSGPRPGTYEFWTASPRHNPRLRKGQDEWLRFKDGHIIVDNDTDAQRIREALRGQAFETDWPEDRDPPKCPITGYAPRSYDAQRAYDDWSRPKDPMAF